MKLQRYSFEQNENEIPFIQKNFRGFPTFSRSEKVGTSHEPARFARRPSKGDFKFSITLIYDIFNIILLNREIIGTILFNNV